MTTRGLGSVAVRRAVPPLQTASGRWWRSSVLGRARDGSAGAGTGRCVVVAPHPDDETFGCGGLLARKVAAGAEVAVVLLSDGTTSHPRVPADVLGAVRRAEFEEACSALGVPRHRRTALGAEDGGLARDVPALAHAIGDVVDELGADEVLVTSRHDGHPDHVAASAAAELVLRHRPGVGLLEYPVWSWLRGPLATVGGDGPRWARALTTTRVLLASGAPVAVDLAPYRSTKARAMDAYTSQLRDLSGVGAWHTMPAGAAELFLGDAEVFFDRGRPGGLAAP